MIKKLLSLVVVGLMLYGVNLQIISAQTNTDNSVEKMKTDVYRRGTGEKSKVVVKMKDGTKRKGFISQIGEDSFDLTDSKTKQSTAIAYRDVAQVKKQGLSTGAKVLIGVGIGVVITAVVLGVAVSKGLDGLGNIGIGRPQ